MPKQEPDISWDFFYYAETLVNKDEIEADLKLGILQPRGKQYFNRFDATIVANKINSTNTIALQILIRYDITRWAGFRNSVVDNGEFSGRDQRAAISQSTIEINIPNNDKKNLDVLVGYIRLEDRQQEKVTINI